MLKNNTITKMIYWIKDKVYYIKAEDVISLALLLIAIPYALILKMTQKNVWLVCERKTEARDNGYVFFKYVLEHTKAVNIYYAIDKKSDDYNKLKCYNKKIIQFGSIRHMAYYLGSEAVISTVKNCGPNDLMGFLFRILRIANNKIYFIGHGIVINDQKWLYYAKTKFRLITSGAYPEYEFIRNHFGYPNENITFVGGMCRYDYLHDLDVLSQKYILIMPTWRKWLRQKKSTLRGKDNYSFIKTNYYQSWTRLIHNKEMLDIIKKNNIKMIFYPHPTMQYYIKDFKSISENVAIADVKNCDIQKLIRNAAMLITDYSSVFMDFIYMKKPIIFYQFDLQNFRKYHYSEGYFQYDNNSFSNAVYCIKDVNEKLENIINHNFQVDQQYLEEHKKYFPIWDANNSERTFNAISKIIYKKEE